MHHSNKKRFVMSGNVPKLSIHAFVVHLKQNQDGRFYSFERANCLGQAMKTKIFIIKKGYSLTASEAPEKHTDFNTFTSAQTAESCVTGLIAKWTGCPQSDGQQQPLFGLVPPGALVSLSRNTWRLQVGPRSHWSPDVSIRMRRGVLNGVQSSHRFSFISLISIKSTCRYFKPARVG